MSVFTDEETETQRDEEAFPAQVAGGMIGSGWGV